MSVARTPRPMRVGIFGQLLLAFLLVALVPLALFWYFEHARIIETDTVRAQANLRVFARRVVQQVDDWTDLNLAVLQLAADSPEMRSMDPARQRAVVDAVLRRLPWAYLIHTTDLSGMNVARSDGRPAASYAWRKYFQDVAAGQPYSAEIQLGRTSGQPAFLLGVRIADDRAATSGVLIEAARLDEVVKSIGSAHIGRTGIAFLMTEDGRLIAHRHERLDQRLLDYRTHPAFAAAHRGEEGVFRYMSGGIERMGVIRRTKLGWIAVAQQDVAESLQAVKAANRFGLLLLAVTGALVTLLSAFVARGFARPIERVTRVAEDISRGKIQFSVSTQRRDQIGDLLRAMHEVGQTLTRFVGAQRALAHAHDRGELDHRIDSSGFEGVYREMSDAVDEVVAGHVQVTQMLREVIDRYAVGDFSVDLPELPGKKRELTQTTSKAKRNLLEMQNQIVRLVEAAARGDFSERGDEGRFQFAFRDMVRHLNKLMQTADRGLTELAHVLAAIAGGDLTVSMQGAYEGTFAQLQRDTNATVEALATSIRQIEINREFLRATLDHLPQGVSVVDTELRLVAWNRRYLEIFEYPPGLVEVGVSIEKLMRCNLERGLLGRGDPRALLQRRLDHLRGDSSHVHEREFPDGTVLEIRGSPLPGIGYVSSYSDVTAYKRTEVALRTLTESLERRVSERTHELEAATEQAHRANRAKSRFLAAAVHDLSQPITAARLYVSALKSDLAYQPAGELVRRADATLASVEGVFAQLMDISRLESGKLRLDVTDVALASLFESLVEEFEAAARSRGLELRRVACSAVVRSDPVLLRRLLQNYVSNAIRYTRSGRVLLGCRRHGAMCRLEVWDTGIGIAPDKTRDIFEEFHRLNPSGGDAQPGAGLGLAIVENIAQALNHAIGVRSRPDRGSVFFVEVPTCMNARQLPQRAAHAGPIPGSGLKGVRVWCIDDDRDVRDSTRAVLERWGCDVTLCRSGREALTLARRAPPPDILMLDFRLGDTTGAELLPRLDYLWERELPTLLITGEQPGSLPRELLARVRVLPKPLPPEMLRSELVAIMLASAPAD